MIEADIDYGIVSAAGSTGQIRASIEFQFITTETSVLVPLAAIEYQLITVSDVEFKYLQPVNTQFDRAWIVDTTKFDFSKYVSDAALLQETFLAVLGRPLADEAASTDAQALHVIKSINDAALATDDVDGALSALDDQTISFIKSRSDRPQAYDSFYRVLEAQRQFNELPSTVDITAFEFIAFKNDYPLAADLTSWYFEKSTVDSASPSDAVSLNTTTTHSDSVGLSHDDLEFIWHHRRNLADSALTAESTEFELLTLEERQKRFTKSVLDAARVTETFSSVATFYRNFFETLDVSDTFSPQQDGDKLDTSSVTDLAALDSLKALFDPSAISDAPSQSFSSPKTESLSATDVFEVRQGKSPVEQLIIRQQIVLDMVSAISERTAVADAKRFELRRALSEIVTFSDATTLSRGRPFSDTATATDDVNGALVPLDDQTISFFKAARDSARISEQINLLFSAGRAVAESVNIVETVNKLTSKNPSDSALCSESGVLLLQDYVVNGYLADDYVGTQTVF